MSTSLTFRDLNRATLRRQHLIDRADGPVAEVIGRLGGLQAQHATWPYVALWTRRVTASVTELEAALTDKSVVRATLMRVTLHLVSADDVRALDAMGIPSRLTNWRPSAARAGLDLLELNAEVRAYCDEPRAVAEIEAQLAGRHPGIDPYAHVPGGARNAWFRLASAGGGLVHVPPSGFWKEHGKPRYLDADVWLGATTTPPPPDEALRTGVERFLAAYGPATLADIVQWAGLRRLGELRAAVAALGDRIVEFSGPGADPYLDLAEFADGDMGALAAGDADVPPRFLARWDSLLIGFAKSARQRLIDPAYVPAVYKKNGDVLPTFLVDGTVAGLWSWDAAGTTATLQIEPFGDVPARHRTALADEAATLIRYLAPDAAVHEVTWAP